MKMHHNVGFRRKKIKILLGAETLPLPRLQRLASLPRNGILAIRLAARQLCYRGGQNAKRLMSDAACFIVGGALPDVCTC